MLGIGLREHHEFDIGRISAELAVGGEQVVDLVSRQGKTELGIGADQGLTAGGQRYPTQRPRRLTREQRLRLLRRRQHHLGHAVVQQGRDRGVLRRGQIGDAALRQAVLDAALDAPHGAESADLRDVGRLAGPRRNGAGPRHDPQRDALATLATRGARLGYARLARPIGQQRLETLAFVSGKWTLEIDEVDVRGRDAGDRRTVHTQAREELGDPERGQGGRTADREHGLPALFL